MKLAVCEDDAIINNLIVQYLEEMGHEVVASEYSKDAFFEVINDLCPDLVVLDINLGEGKEGVQIGHYLRERNIPFIYITAYSDPDTLKEAISVEPLGYLVKPFTQAQLVAQIQFAKSQVDVELHELHVGTGSHFFNIDLREINHIESSRNYLIFHAIDMNEAPIKVRLTLKEILDKIPSYYFQVHRSFLVNKRQISLVEKDLCKMKNQAEIPVSRNYKVDFLNELQSK